MKNSSGHTVLRGSLTDSHKQCDSMAVWSEYVEARLKGRPALLVISWLCQFSPLWMSYEYELLPLTQLHNLRDAWLLVFSLGGAFNVHFDMARTSDGRPHGLTVIFLWMHPRSKAHEKGVLNDHKQQNTLFLFHNSIALKQFICSWILYVEF